MKREKIIFWSLISFGFLIRILLSFFKGFRVDMSAWYSWADRLVSLGPANFYHPDIWTHYTPGYLFILWGLGWLKKLFSITDPFLLLQLFKLPNNLADIITAVLIFKIVKIKSSKWAWTSFLLYLLNPAVIFNSSVWGQADSLLNLLLVSTIYFLLNKNKIITSSLIYSLALLVKPQALFIFPLIIVFFLKQRKFLKGIIYLSLALLMVLFLALPFFPYDPFFGLFKLIIQMGEDYAYTSLNAFNLWGLIAGWQQDAALFLNFSYQQWGLFIFLFWEAIVAFFLLKKKGKKRAFYLAGALFLFNFFLFPTRVHERYLLSTLPFLLIATGLYRSVVLLLGFIFLSFAHLVNLFFVYNYYYPDFSKITNVFGGTSFLLSLITIFVYLITLFFWVGKLKEVKFDSERFLSFFKINKITNRWIRVKNVKLYLGLILFFSFVIRVFNIWHPPDYIFDEVYHGFTAQEMAKGNIKAWEWWNASPEGFAYEWTHPPLAKLFMAGGVLLFGQNNKMAQYAFRFPATLFGVGVIYLTYLIARQVFKNEKIGLLAAFILAFDGLLFVMSRVGMADVYFLFFLLFTILLSLKKNYLLSAVCLGMAIGTKWTGLYLFPAVIVLLVKQFLEEKNTNKIRLKYVVSFLGYFIVPPLVYLLCYLPFFTSGHSFDRFLELQKQMWWYHTSLKATHPYQSSALTWPIMWRPVWFWVKYEENKIGNIYNLGNPIIWWTGVFILPWILFKVIKRFLKFKELNLALIVFFYFIFFLPWTFSPRIMFLHHYLPAVPFLTILIAWFLNESRNWSKNSSHFVYFYLSLVVVAFFFFYPLYAGVLLPKNLVDFFFWFPSWK